MVNDRGTKKWTSLMLPEHVDILKSMFTEQVCQQKPILDEQQMMENEVILKHAVHKGLVVKVKYFKNHDFQVNQGKITNIIDGHLWINESKIYLEDIIEVHSI